MYNLLEGAEAYETLIEDNNNEEFIRERINILKQILIKLDKNKIIETINGLTDVHNAEEAKFSPIPLEFELEKNFLSSIFNPAEKNINLDEIFEKIKKMGKFIDYLNLDDYLKIEEDILYFKNRMTGEFESQGNIFELKEKINKNNFSVISLDKNTPLFDYVKTFHNHHNIEGNIFTFISKGVIYKPVSEITFIDLLEGNLKALNSHSEGLERLLKAKL
jgi:hypothetical protein